MSGNPFRDPERIEHSGVLITGDPFPSSLLHALAAPQYEPRVFMNGMREDRTADPGCLLITRTDDPIDYESLAERISKPGEPMPRRIPTRKERNRAKARRKRAQASRRRNRR